MPSVYLGGRISGLSWEQARKPRLEASRILSELGFTVLDPMEKESRLAGAECLSDFQSAKMLGVAFGSIIDADEAALDASDYYLLLTGDSPSWGTGFEAAYCYYVRGIPVVSVGNTSPPSGWLDGKSDYVAGSIREACYWISGHSRGLSPAQLEYLVPEWVTEYGALR